MCCASMDCWGMCCIIPFPNRNHRSRTPLLLAWEINSRGSDICTVPLVNHIREEHFLVVSCRKLKNYIFHCSFHKALAIVHKTLYGTLSDSTFAVFAFPLHSRLSFHLLSLALCKQYLICNRTVWFCPCLGFGFCPCLELFLNFLTWYPYSLARPSTTTARVRGEAGSSALTLLIALLKLCRVLYGFFRLEAVNLSVAIAVFLCCFSFC